MGYSSNQISGKKEEVKTEQQLKKEKFARALKASIKDMKKYDIEPGDDVTGMLPSLPYEKPDSKRFFKAVKLEKFHTVWDMLIEDKFLVHQFDHVSSFLLKYFLALVIPTAYCS